MPSTSASRIVLVVTAAIVLTGCGARKGGFKFRNAGDMSHYKHAATRIEEPCIDAGCRPWQTAPPVTILSDEPPVYRDLTLEEAVHTALTNSTVLRDLSAQVLDAPGSLDTIHDPAIRETDPRFGIEAALSAFDAELATSAFFEKNDRALNNTFFGGGTRQLTQDLAIFQTRITKRSAVGTQFTVRHDTDYDSNNAPGNRFPSAWNTLVDAEFRHPLLRGAGITYNRIAGPMAIAGVPNGVLIARVDADISLAEFELSLVKLVSEVENAYWDLYFAYRDLDAKIAARDRALTTWKSIDAWAQSGRLGGEADQEAQAREQYFRFEEEVQNALTGRLLDYTENNNGSSGGTFRPVAGVHVAERRLRLLMGVEISDGSRLRPIHEPNMSYARFDWYEILPESLARRGELRRQRWTVKRRELELIASRNFLLPQLDTVGRYRFRGFGDDLLDPDREGRAQFDNAYKNLTSGDFQEWQLGFEFSMPLGHRRGHAAVRNAQMTLARERAVLIEQERQVTHDLTAAVADMDRAYVVAQTNYNRRLAAIRQLAVLEHRYESESTVDLDLLLDAQRRLSDADSRYYQSLVEYALAVKNIHYEKGSLLDYNEVYLAEGPWPGKAYRDAARRDRFRMLPGPLNYILPPPLRVSMGLSPRPTWTVTPGYVATETEAVISPPQEVDQEPSTAGAPAPVTASPPKPMSSGPAATVETTQQQLDVAGRPPRRLDVSQPPRPLEDRESSSGAAGPESPQENATSEEVDETKRGDSIQRESNQRGIPIENPQPTPQREPTPADKPPQQPASPSEAPRRVSHEELRRLPAVSSDPSTIRIRPGA